MSTKSAILKTFFSLAIAGVLAGGLSVSARADDDRLDEAWKDGIGDQEPVLTDQQFAKLNNLAFQAAVTKICDGYNLDDKKFADGMADATTPADAAMSADEPEDVGDRGPHPLRHDLRTAPRRGQRQAQGFLQERRRAQGHRDAERLAIALAFGESKRGAPRHGGASFLRRHVPNGRGRWIAEKVTSLTETGRGDRAKHGGWGPLMQNHNRSNAQAGRAVQLETRWRWMIERMPPPSLRGDPPTLPVRDRRPCILVQRKMRTQFVHIQYSRQASSRQPST